VGIAQPPTGPSPTSESLEKQTILLGILRSINQLEQELKAKQQEWHSPEGAGLKEELTQDIQQISIRLKVLRENLNELATGVDMKIFTQQENEDVDWQKSVVDLLRPLISELSRLSTRPREIEYLRREIAVYQKQRQLIDKAIKSIESLRQQQLQPSLVTYLRQLQQEWKGRQQDIDTQLSLTSQHLQQQLDEQPSLAESIQTLLQLFFRSRGRNFLLACLAFVLVWLMLHRLQSWFQSLRLFHHKSHTFSVRLFHVIYTFFTIVGAVLSFILVLYYFEDWVLLTLALLFLLGIAWTSKQALPRFAREVTLLLNIGAVRERERVMYNGIPWLVQSLNFHTRLVNPELEGGDIHLPLRDFHDLRSRPYKSNEPWFPTRMNDWVLLSDQTLGKVVLQTPEMVRLLLLGGARRTFSVADFLAQSPLVLSTGFRLEVVFGLDYQYQARITQEIPLQLSTKLHEALEQEGYAQHLVNLTIEFAEAAASSLNLQVLADFGGEAAPQYHLLRRAIQRFSVDACNDNGWVIPFTQLTLHVAHNPDTADLLALNQATHNQHIKNP
jgi:hypothetical protein